MKGFAAEPRTGHERRRGGRRAAVALAVLLLLAPAALLAGKRVRAACESSPRFAIREIAVIGNQRIGAEEVIAAAGIVRGANLLRLSAASAEGRLAQHPWVASAEVIRRFPNAVQVRIVEREPVALLCAGDWFGVSGDGVLLPLTAVGETFELPILGGCCGRDGPDPDRLRRGAVFLGLVEERCAFLLRDLSEVNVADPADLVAYTMGTGTAVRFGEGGMQEKLERLVLVLEDLSGRDKIPATIDLRFRGQAVVRFTKTDGEA